MSDRNLDLAMRVSADTREGIEVFRTLKRGAVETKKEFEAATERVSKLAAELAAAEQPSAKLKREFEAAKREAAGLKDALQQQEQRLNSSRQALAQAGVNVKDLAAEYRRLKAESAAAAAAIATGAQDAARAQVEAARLAAAEQDKQARWAAVARSRAERQVREESEATAAAQIAAARKAAAEQEKLSRWAAVARSRSERAAAAAAASQARASRLDSIGAAIDRSTPSAFDALNVRSSASIQAEINKVQQAMQRLAADSRVSGAEFDRAFAAGGKRIAELRGQLDPTTAAVARMTGGVGDLNTQLGPLQSALAGVAAAFSAQRILALAEEYQQYTARLRLATQYTGDFLEVQAALRSVAREARAPLAETVNLYSRLGPSLNAMGRDGQQAAAVVSTVTKSIALSGASAAASEASLVQFGQAMGSGVLRGEELNSILEQTPALADAIAEGMGRTRGELKRMGEQGVLTSQAVVAALENIAGRVDRDFAQLPQTVGQSFVILRNETLELVGGMDRALGATNALARGITWIADNIEEVVQYGVPLLVVALVPLIARLGMTTAAAVKAAIALAAVNPVKAALGVAAAAAAYAGLNAVLDEVADKQGKLTAQEEEQQLKRNADARLKIEQDLANATLRLQKLRAVEAGKANASILLSTKEAIEKGAEIQRKAIADQIKGYEALGSKLDSVWDDALAKARALREESARLLLEAGDARQAGIDKGQDRRMRGWSAEERDAFAGRQARDLTDSANRSATFARNAALNGNIERAAQLAAEAAKFAERAEKYADIIQDDDVAANLFEELGRIREEALKAQAQIKETEARAQEDLAAAVTQQIAENEARLKALRAELEKPATLKADITQAEAQIAALKQQLDGLKDKTVTITVNTVSTAPADTSGMTREELIESIPGRAYGGPLPGRAFSDRSDNVIYRGTPGEWVIQRPAVRYWGSSFLRAINEMRMPKFAYGGEIGADQRQALSDYEGAGSKTPIVLQWPDGSRSPMAASADVADQVVRLFRTAALQRGRRR